MNKSFRTAAILVLFTVAVLAAGCGSDKFSGKWINADAGSGNPVIELNITKNGTGYIITETESHYAKSTVFANEKEVARIKRENDDLYMKHLFQAKPQMQEVPVSLYDYTFTWTNQGDKKMTGIAKDNRLTIDNSLGMAQITYVEKDDTLLLDNRTFRKEKDKDIENIKSKEQQKLRKELETMKVMPGTKVNKVTFVDAPTAKK